MTAPNDRAMMGAFGTPICRTFHVERGKLLVAADPALGSQDITLFEGRGLMRGVAYLTYEWGVERGYLVGPMGQRCRLLDAVNGRMVEVESEDCVEVEDRYRRPTIKEAFDAQA